MNPRFAQSAGNFARTGPNVGVVNRPGGPMFFAPPPLPAAATVVPERHELQLLDASEPDDAKVTLLAGTVHNKPVTETTFDAIDGESVWIKFPVEYDTTTGSWKASSGARDVYHGDELPDEDGSWAILLIGTVAVDDDDAVTFHGVDGEGQFQVRYGPVFWSRPGGPEDFDSDWISPGP